MTAQADQADRTRDVVVARDTVERLNDTLRSAYLDTHARLSGCHQDGYQIVVYTYPDEQARLPEELASGSYEGFPVEITFFGVD